MKTYQFESVIDENGAIVLPREIKRLQKHRVKLTIVDLEASYIDPVRMLANITDKYITINEDDLDIVETYEQREKHHDRGIVFD